MAYVTSTLTSDSAVLSLASAPNGQAVICGTKMNAVDRTLDGAVRKFAGNRMQAVIYDQDDTASRFTVMHISMADVQKLLLWRGKPVLLRTFDGQRHHGVFWVVPYERVLFTVPDNNVDTVTYNVDLDFNKVTFIEDV